MGGKFREPRVMENTSNSRGLLVATWGVGGVLLLFAQAIWRLGSRAIEALGYPLDTTQLVVLVGWVVVNFALVIATSVVALRSDVLPTWLGWVGFVAVVLAIVEVFLAPVFVIPVWLLIVSIVLAVHEPTRASAT